MGIRFYCPNGHKLNVKTFQAGRRGICPYCGVSMMIPTESTGLVGIQGSAPVNGQRDQPATPSMAQPISQLSQPSGPSSPPSAAQPAMTAMSPSAPSMVTPSPTSSPVQPAPRGTPTAATWSAAQAPLESPRLAAQAEPVAATPTAATPPDPLTEAPTAVWYVRPAAGGQYGPATGDIMRAWLAEGRVGADSLVWREGWRDWQEASQVFPQLKPDDMTLLLSGKTGKPSPSVPPPATRRSGAPTAMIIAGLALTVVVLVIVFLVIFFQRTSPQPEQTTAPAAKAAMVAPLAPQELT